MPDDDPAPTVPAPPTDAPTADDPFAAWAAAGAGLNSAARATAVLPNGPRPAAFTPPPAPPGYVLDGELGRGGMGVVYRATQTALNRPVALKMILSGDRAAAGERLRFLAEAEAMATVRHPHVVPVYDFGTADGRPYLALEYLPGGSLAARLKSGPLPVREAAGLVAKVADGVQAAHDLGIVHRDLKPANVLLDAGGEPKVTDFGLAKRAGGSDLTATHAIMGTPQYMAPEQARGGAKFVGPAADVYALGAILFECLAGRPPFAGDDPVRLLLAAAEQDAPDVRRLAPHAPRDLAVVVRKCLEKEPAARYPSAAALADDLRRFLDGRPVLARPVGATEQLWRWARRNPVPAALLALVAALLTVGGVGSMAAAARLRSLATAERQARQDADDRADQLAAAGYAQRVALAELEVAAGNYGRAEDHLAGCPPELRRWEWQFLRNAVAAARAGPPDRGHRDVVWAAAFAPDGRLATVSADGTARMTDLAGGGRPVKSFPVHRTTGLAVAWSPDGKRLATAGIGRGERVWEVMPRHEVRLWDAAAGTPLWLDTGHEGFVTGVAFSPDGARLATASWDGRCRVLDAATGQELAVFRGHAAGGAHGVTFLPDGRRVATAGRDRTVRLWDAATGAELAAGHGHLSAVSKVAVRPGGKLLATAGMDGDARLWDADTLAPRGVLVGHTQPLFGLAWHPAGDRLATAGMDALVKLWEPDGGRELLTLRGHRDVVWDVAFSPDGHRLVSASHDDTWRVWDGDPAGPAGDRPYRDLAGARKPVMAVAVGPGGEVAAGGFDQTVRVWPAAGGPARELAGHADAVAGLGFGPGGGWLLSAGWDKTVRRWDLATGQAVWNTPVDAMPQGLAVRPGGAEVAVPDWFGKVQVLDAATGKVRLTLPAAHLPYPCYAVAYSTDGRRFATGGGDRMVKLWDADTGKLLQVFRGHDASVFGVAVLPGGKVVGGSWDRTVRVWDAATGKEERTLAGHTARVYAVRGSADGRLVYSAGEDNAVRVWEVATGREVGRLDNPAGVYALDVAADGRSAAVGLMAPRDGVRRWTLPAGLQSPAPGDRP